MSVRKRTWKTAAGEAKDAWVVDYVDQAGKRRLKTFKKMQTPTIRMRMLRLAKA